MNKSIKFTLTAALTAMFIGCDGDSSKGSNSSKSSADKSSNAVAVLANTIVDAMGNANANAMAMNGSKLVMSIIARSISGNDVWAHNDTDGWMSDDPDMINGRNFTSSTEYFRALFDIENETSTAWRPWIDGELKRTLWGFGVPPAKAGELNPENVGWIFVKGMPADAPGTIPVLISRNVDPSQFATQGTNDMSAKKDELKFTGDFAIIVYKSGSSQVLERGARLCDVYKDQPVVDFTDGVKLEYMMP